MPQQYANAFAGPNLAAIDESAYRNDLLANERNRLPQYNRQQDQQIEAQDLAVSAQQRQNARGVLANRFAAVATSTRPRDAARAFIGGAEFQTAGKLLGLPVEQFQITDADDDASVQAQARDWAQVLGASIAAPAKPVETIQGPGGSILQRDPDTGRMQAVLGREPLPPNQPQTEPLETIVGTDGRPLLVPRSRAAGEQPYQKPTGGLSPRDSTTARNKLTQIQLARQQVADARQKFEAIKGTFSAGPGGAYIPTQAGQAFDASVDMMRSTITGIMRVPGVGSMSDYESRLDQSKIPSRGKYESTTVQQLDSLDQMLNQLEQGYSGLIQDNGGGQPQAPEVTATGPNGQKIVLRNGQWVPL